MAEQEQKRRAESPDQPRPRDLDELVPPQAPGGFATYIVRIVILAALVLFAGFILVAALRSLLT